ncbi:hypothetical protein ABW19_dt0207664 [Dactylella cylindrospora]|nr:hypothetical protein ABW19_dt0207664 [Dactylella cylindrospora]
MPAKTVCERGHQRGHPRSNPPPKSERTGQRPNGASSAQNPDLQAQPFKWNPPSPDRKANHVPDRLRTTPGVPAPKKQSPRKPVRKNNHNDKHIDQAVLPAKQEVPRAPVQTVPKPQLPVSLAAAPQTSIVRVGNIYAELEGLIAELQAEHKKLPKRENGEVKASQPSRLRNQKPASGPAPNGVGLGMLNPGAGLLQGHFKAPRSCYENMSRTCVLGDHDEARREILNTRMIYRNFTAEGYKDITQGPRKFVDWCRSCRGRGAGCPACDERKRQGLPRPEPSTQELQELYRNNPLVALKLYPTRIKEIGVEKNNVDEVVVNTVLSKLNLSKRKAAKEEEARNARNYVVPEWEKVKGVAEKPRPKSDGEYPAWDPTANIRLMTHEEKAAQAIYQLRTGEGLIEPGKRISHWDDMGSIEGDSDPHVGSKDVVEKKKPKRAKKQPKGPKATFANTDFTSGFKLGPRPVVNIRYAPEEFCFNCWDTSHRSQQCKQPRVVGVREQERQRVQKGRGLTKKWHQILRDNGIEPTGPLELEEPVAQDVQSAIESPVQDTGKDITAGIFDEENVDTGFWGGYGQSGKEQQPSDSRTGIAQGRSQHAHGQPYKMKRVPRQRRSLTAFDDSGSEHRNLELMYHSVAAGSETSGSSKTASPINNLPNEILMMIFRCLIDCGSTAPSNNPIERPILTRAADLKHRNQRLDVVRKTCNRWRSICQVELYSEVAICSVRELGLFADSVDRDPTLARLVHKLEIETSLQPIREEGSLAWCEQLDWADHAADDLRLILKSCTNLKQLIAKVDGSMRTLTKISNSYPGLSFLAIRDGLVRLEDAKGLWNMMKQLPNLQDFEIEYPWGVKTGENLTLKDQPIWETPFNPELRSLIVKNVSNFHDKMLQASLHKLPKLKALSVSECEFVTSQGLATALKRMKDNQLEYLGFKVFTYFNGASKTESNARKFDHLCEVIPKKFGNSLVEFNLTPYYLCDKIFRGTKWKELKQINIDFRYARGCSCAICPSDFVVEIEEGDNGRLRDIKDNIYLNWAVADGNEVLNGG